MQFPYTYGRDVSSKYPNVTINIEHITPDIAEQMLIANIRNRDTKKEPLKKALLNGEWVLNGATIVFSDEGILLDGQHRLKACVDTGVPIDAIVVRGIADDTQETMDTGVKRSLADWIKMNGYPNSPVVASIAVALYRADRLGTEFAFTPANNSEATLKSQIRFFVDNYENRIQPLSIKAQPLYRKYKRTGVSMWAAVIEILENGSADEDDVNLFLKQLMGSAVPCQSVLTLKNKLEANSKSTKGHLPTKTIAAYVIKTFNAYMRGEDIKCLMFRVGGAHPEDFPTVYNDEMVVS